MVYLALEEDNIPVGNFTFIYDATQNLDLFNKFYDAEKNLKVDYMDFAHKIRMAFEAFALEEEAQKRKCQDNYKDMQIEGIKEQIIEEIKKPATLINYKNIIIDLCNGRELEFVDMLLKFSFIRNTSDEDYVRRKLKAYIRFLYAFGSESSHENISTDKKYLANRENCLMVIGSLHDFLCMYYRVEKKYDSTLTPVRDYVPVPKAIVEKMSLSLDTGKHLFVKECRGKISYYVFSSDIEGISKGQRRDIDTISKLWDDNFDDPANVIRQTEKISGSNGDYRFQVYYLPSRPLKLTEEFLRKLSLEDKLDIIAGLCRGIESVHNYETPLYHRNISPDAFYIFDIRGKYKPLLAKFDCTKDTANSDFTVFQNVEKKVQNQKTNQFFAPDVLNSNMGQGVDWEKADIFSLAKMCFYILIGTMINDETIFDTISEYNIDDNVKIILMEMMSVDPNARPALVELMDALNC